MFLVKKFERYGHARQEATLKLSLLFFVLSLSSLIVIVVLFFITSIKLSEAKINAYFEENYYWLSLSAEAELGRLSTEVLKSDIFSDEPPVHLKMSDAISFRLQILWSRIDLLSKGKFGKWVFSDPQATFLIKNIVSDVKLFEEKISISSVHERELGDILNKALSDAKSLTFLALSTDRAIKDNLFQKIQVLQTMTKIGISTGFGSVLLLAFFAVGYVRIIHQKQQYIEKINGDLEKLVHEREYFIKVASHELRNSAQAVVALIGKDWSNDRVLSDDTMTAMTGFQENVDSMLDFARALAGRVDFTTSELDLEKTLRNWIEAAAGSLEIDIELTIESNYKTVHVQRLVLFRGFQNIFNNALRYARDKIRVLAEVSGDGTKLKIRVDDDGPGFPDTVLDALEKNQSAQQETSGSLGMGILIVRSLVFSVGGALSFPRTASGGSVEISIPIRQNEVHCVEVSRKTKVTKNNVDVKGIGPSDEKFIRVLFCEDSDSIRQAFVILLSMKVGLVDQCGSVAEFTEIYSGKEYDVALLDYNIGDGTAYDIYNIVMKINPNCKIILLTGSDSITPLNSGYADYILKKPVHFSEISQAIDAVTLQS